MFCIIVSEDEEEEQCSRKLVSVGLKIRAYWEVREKLSRNCAILKVW